MASDATSSRDVSFAIFGNEKLAAVVVALDQLRPATATQIADHTRLRHSLVRDVLQRLVRGGVLSEMRTSGRRGPLFYDAVHSEVWTALVSLGSVVMSAPAVTTDPPEKTTTPAGEQPRL